MTQNLIKCVAYGGNYLLNVGPQPDGTIAQRQSDPLDAIGTWTGANSAAIRSCVQAGITSPLPSWGAVTRRGNRLFAHIFDWQDGATVHLDELAPYRVRRARTLVDGRHVTVAKNPAGGWDLTLSGNSPDDTGYAAVVEVDVTTRRPTAPRRGSGLTARYWGNTSFDGDPVATRTERLLSFVWGADGVPAAGMAPSAFSARFTGTLLPQFAETYTFQVIGAPNDAISLWIDDVLVTTKADLNVGTTHYGPGRPVDWSTYKLLGMHAEGTAQLDPAHRHTIRVDFQAGYPEATFKLIWSSPSTPRSIVPAANLLRE